MNSHLILCGGARETSCPKAWRKVDPLYLEIGKGASHVHLKIEHLARGMCTQLSPVAIDLLEIASYIFVADQAIRRGGTQEFDYAQRWRRNLRFAIPVRRPDKWQREDVTTALRGTLGFLSDDDYEFKFVKHKAPRPVEEYLFDEGHSAEFEEVILFSGGLDALGGAVQEVLQGQRKVALVSHRPVSKTYAIQRKLVQAISDRVSQHHIRPLHVAVEVNKGRKLEADFTQRTGAFLFTAIGALVARCAGLNRIRFYENGITSFNLPICEQLLGGRASRTTHPKALQNLGQLISLLFDTSFQVENPFLWKTKADLLAEIKAAGHGHLCASSVSCSHTHAMSTQHTHCGRCSQCVDRRISAIAAGLDESEDPPSNYKSDVFIGECSDTDTILCERHVGSARQIDSLQNARQFGANAGELSRIYRQLDMPASDAAEQTFHLHKRHAKQVLSAVRTVIEKYSDHIVRGQLPNRCFITTVWGGLQDVCSPSPPKPPELAATTIKQEITIDEESLELVVGNKRCFLGNGKEFSLIQRLLKSRGVYLSYEAIIRDVWNDAFVEKNTVQRTVSNLRRKLKENEIVEIEIDGSQQGRYRLNCQLPVNA